MGFSWLATRDLSLSTLTIHVYIAGPAQAAKHLLTTTRPTHDRSTRGNFGLAEQLVADYRALGDGDALPPRSVYDRALMTVHERSADIGTNGQQ